MTDRRTNAAAERAANQRAGSRGNSAAGSKGAADRSEAEPPRTPQDRGVRRAIFLAELAEAKELRKRVAPRRARAAELHARLLRTFRY